jgi:hypothetical protein
MVTSQGQPYGAPSTNPISPILQTTFVDMPEEAKKSYYELSNLNFEGRTAAARSRLALTASVNALAAVQQPKLLIGVAEGDSWFDYAPAFLEDPTKGDLLGHLHRLGRYNIYNLAKAGDTLENMAYGTDVGSHQEPSPAELLSTIDAIKLHRPDFFLLSAGGNDLAGADGIKLEAFLNHASTGLPPLRKERALETFQTYHRAALKWIIDRVKEAKTDIEIFIHGYDYAVPDGRPVFQAPLGFHFVGPWLLPAFARKRTWPGDVRQQVIDQLIDLHNETIADLAINEPQVHHIDCRRVLQPNTSDWANELHPTASGFGKIAAKFDEIIQGVFQTKAEPSNKTLIP